MNSTSIIVAIITGLICMAIAIALGGLVVMILFNFVAPTFGLPTVTFLEGLAIYGLCYILFNSSKASYMAGANMKNNSNGYK